MISQVHPIETGVNKKVNWQRLINDFEEKESDARSKQDVMKNWVKVPQKSTDFKQTFPRPHCDYKSCQDSLLALMQYKWLNSFKNLLTDRQGRSLVVHSN